MMNNLDPYMVLSLSGFLILGIGWFLIYASTRDEKKK
jgi:hypothetical protein